MTRKTGPFSVRLKDAERPLELGATVAGESRGAFIREAVHERADRLLREARQDLSRQCQRGAEDAE